MKNLLIKLPLFIDFDTHEIDIIEKLFSLKTYKKNEIINKDKDKELSVITSGKILSTLKLPGSIGCRQEEYCAGDFFGGMSLFGFKSPFDIYRAVEKSEILSINENNIINLINNNPKIAVKFISRVITLTIQHLRKTSKFFTDIVQWGEDASRRVITDELTEVYNRYFLEDAINDFFSISKSNGKPLSLFMMDIDNFRVINDTLGYETGNNILLYCVSMIKSIVSRYGIIGRYGGDEFCILLPETDLKKALAIAETIREAIEQSDFSKYMSGSEIPVTASIGISSFPDTATDIESFKEKADTSLYKAKENGRNRVAYVK